MNRETCLICGGHGFETVASYDRPDPYETAVGVPEAGYERSWRRCRGCGFHQSRYARDPDVLDRLYMDAYRDRQAEWRSGDTKEVFKKVIALPAEESETKQRIAWLQGSLTDLEWGGLFRPSVAPRFLDVGGATGVFAYEFRAATGWRAHVSDPASSGLYLTEDYDIPYVQAPYRAGQFDTDFDLITLVFALEHFRDPDGSLKEARKDLTGKGAVYVEVPDALAFDRLPPDDDIFNACHLWMFDPKSLIALMHRHEFHVGALRRYRTARGHYALAVLGSLQ